jgi:hypothetical protein
MRRFCLLANHGCGSFMVDAMAVARRAFEQDGLREKLPRHHGDNTETMF